MKKSFQMKSFKLLNRKYLSILLFSLSFGFVTESQEPIDVWSTEENKTIEKITKSNNPEIKNIQQNSIYEMQSQKVNESNIKEDQTLIFQMMHLRF